MPAVAESHVRLATGACVALLVFVASIGVADENRSRIYTVAPFERVYFSGAGTLQLSQGDATAVSVEAAHDVIDTLIIESHDGALFIDTGISATGSDTNSVNVHLMVPNLRELVSVGEGIVTARALVVGDLSIEGSGGGSFELTGLRANELQVTGIGGTKFSLSGRVDRQVIDIEGSGDYRAAGLSSRSVEAHVSGAGNVRVWVEELLDVEIAGTARVRYSGSPFVSQRVSGLGSVGRVVQTQI